MIKVKDMLGVAALVGVLGYAYSSSTAQPQQSTTAKRTGARLPLPVQTGSSKRSPKTRIIGSAPVGPGLRGPIVLPPILSSQQAATLQATLNSRTAAATQAANALIQQVQSLPPNQPIAPIGTVLNTSLSTANVIASLKASGVPVTQANIQAAVAGGVTPTQGLLNYATYLVSEFTKTYGKPPTAAMIIPTMTEWALPPPAGNGPFTTAQIQAAAQAAVGVS